MKVFCDTYFYIAVISERDPAHKIANEWVKRSGIEFTTTEYVLLELADAFRIPAYRRYVSDLIRTIKSSRKTEVIAASSDIFDKALALYEARPDKDWSLTDCSSFIVMQTESINVALTADHHFRQAGFQPIMDDPSN